MLNWDVIQDRAEYSTGRPGTAAYTVVSESFPRLGWRNSDLISNLSSSSALGSPSKLLPRPLIYVSDARNVFPTGSLASGSDEAAVSTDLHEDK